MIQNVKCPMYERIDNIDDAAFNDFLDDFYNNDSKAQGKIANLE